MAASVEDWKAELLPEGSEKRVEGRYPIETGWAPQAAILAHEATGAFITHCGWNSAVESVVAGVPMMALPLQSDQPSNALLLAREAKVAVEMKTSNGVAEKEVERAVRYLMKSEEMKRRMKALSEATVAAFSEAGGAAWQNLDSFMSRVEKTFVYNENYKKVFVSGPPREGKIWKLNRWSATTRKFLKFLSTRGFFWKGLFKSLLSVVFQRREQN